MIRNLTSDVQAFTSNVFLVTGARNVLVDAGSNFDVVEAVRAHVDAIDAVVLTHSHRDHVENLDQVRAAFDVPVYGFDTAVEGIDEELADGDSVTIGDHEYLALHTPGHKNDHLCLYAEDAGILFAGDLVFDGGSFGRTDLEEGDRPTLIESIDYVLDTVSRDLEVMHTGHGPSVTDRPYETIELAGQAARF
ncbi:MBL fold metallo-hydrolase [Haloarculaceae archaeon H-GB2-1]|nr:MBL fold metallo-hydrolase [Haloarculaceae archaeon H-GB1-1]MEA5385999.1 MBL fold metallo-hydrolase [Haloarculaceae archaeon H-GB11]MEA5407503.1 MBL fold metallo-hydrolase [Haloarculaceae archaeon H-GB2-1]